MLAKCNSLFRIFRVMKALNKGSDGNSTQSSKCFKECSDKVQFDLVIGSDYKFFSQDLCNEFYLEK